MAKTLNFEYEGKEYTLEYTRAAVVRMEKNGFKFSDLENFPISTLPEFFAASFYAHHPNISRKKVTEIYESLGNKEELLPVLSEMYMEPIEALLDEPDDEGKVDWVKNW